MLYSPSSSRADVAVTWFDQLEQKRRLLIGGMVAVCVAALVVTARRKFVGFDGYWHLQTGLDWIHKGLSPWVDHFSFTYSGEPISSQPVIFQVLLAALVDQIGLEAGYGVMKLTAFVLAIGLMILFLRRMRSPALMYLVILPLFSLLLELRAILRPELFSYSLSIIGVMLYQRARGRITASNLLPIALLMLFWTNYHTSTLGYVLFFGFFVDAAFLQVRERAGIADWGKWLGWGLVLFAVGFLNKGFHHPIIDSFHFAPEWRIYIQEYMSVAQYKYVVGIYAMVPIVAATLILAVRQRKFGYVIVTLIFTYESVRMVRLVTPCGIMVLCFLASLERETEPRTRIDGLNEFWRGVVGIGAAALVAISLYSCVIQARYYMRENRTSALSRPESVVAYMKDRQLSGRIFNDFGIGGYLIHELSPDTKVYIDGRSNILYPAEHFRRFLLAKTNPDILREEIARYDINFALLNSEPEAYSVMAKAGVLRLDYVDYAYSLFTRSNPRFPEAGRLLGNPACMDNADRAKLKAEFARALQDLPSNSPLLGNLGLMVEYAEAAEPQRFLREFAQSSRRSQMQVRFAAYQALSTGAFDLSADLFERLRYRDLDEWLSAAMANAQLGRWRRAEQIIDSLTMVHWPYITRNQTILLYRILETMRQNQAAETLSGSYLDDLRLQVRTLGADTTDLHLDYSLLCAD